MEKCVKCGGTNICKAYEARYHDEEKGWIEERILKTCLCGYYWIEDCLDKEKAK